MSLIFTVPKQIVLTDGARPYAGSLAYFFLTGTSTPADTYTTAARNVAHAHPVVADSLGVLPAIYLDPNDDLDVTLRQSDGTLVYTQPHIVESLSVADLGAILYPRTTAEISAGVTPTNYNVPSHAFVGYVDPERYGTNTTPGTTDMTAAWVAAILVAEALANGGTVKAKGDHKIVSTLTISGNRVHIQGYGVEATRVSFAPTANDVLFEFTAGASAITNCSLEGMMIWSADSTYTKTAIDLYDISEFRLKDVRVGGSVVVSSTNYWSGSNSIGLRVRGRQTLASTDLQITADRPILIGANPNNDIDADHFNFHNLYVIANANPCIEVSDGVSLSNFSFTGYQAWVRGTVGFKWVNTAAFAFNPYKISFDNIRTENGTDDTQYAFDISCTSGVIDDVMFKNNYWGSDRKGLRASRVMRITLDGITYASSSLEAMNITGVASGAQNTQLSIRNCYWQTTSTATLTAMRLLWAMPKGGSTQPLPPDAEYAYDGNLEKNFTTNLALGGETITVADGAVAAIGPTGVVGLLVVSGGDGGVGGFVLNGTANDTDEVFDTDTLFSPTAATGSSTNVYWSAGNSRYEIENQRGAQMTYKLTLLGSYTDF